MKILLKIATSALLAVFVLGNVGTVSAQVGYGGGGSSSGTRVKSRIVTPAPLVLGASTTTADVAEACSGKYITDYMRRGMANNAEQVTKLQTFLAEQGMFAVAPTGFFGPVTEASVNSFQVKYATDILTPWNETLPTGYVFKTTRAKINNIKCLASEATPIL